MAAETWDSPTHDVLKLDFDERKGQYLMLVCWDAARMDVQSEPDPS
jgi:hypothetical protein